MLKAAIWSLWCCLSIYRSFSNKIIVDEQQAHLKPPNGFQCFTFFWAVILRAKFSNENFHECMWHTRSWLSNVETGSLGGCTRSGKKRNMIPSYGRNQTKENKNEKSYTNELLNIRCKFFSLWHLVFFERAADFSVFTDNKQYINLWRSCE